MSINLDTGTADREEIIRLLRDAGYRVTQPRIAIVDAVLATPGGFTADGLYDQLRGMAGIGRATVFRTVDTLARLGYLRRLHDEEHCSQYIHTTPGHHHHLICTQCHRVVEFDGCTVDALASELSAQTQFRIQGHWLELFGLCPACQSAA
ncbi:MAG: transcriptional repressor [Chloroflexota bacterium]|nr:transcriptional repressor [Chloroflexota bacterium]